jgi:hypothetical protein
VGIKTKSGPRSNQLVLWSRGMPGNHSVRRLGLWRATEHCLASPTTYYIMTSLGCSTPCRKQRTKPFPLCFQKPPLYWFKEAFTAACPHTCSHCARLRNSHIKLSVSRSPTSLSKILRPTCDYLLRRPRPTSSRTSFPFQRRSVAISSRTLLHGRWILGGRTITTK